MQLLDSSSDKSENLVQVTDIPLLFKIVSEVHLIRWHCKGDMVDSKTDCLQRSEVLQLLEGRLLQDSELILNVDLLRLVLQEIAEEENLVDEVAMSVDILAILLKGTQWALCRSFVGK